jgi:capsular polysaccharide export protein
MESYLGDSMNIVFFAARQLHKEYFSKLAQQLTLRLNKKPSQQGIQHSVDVLWHKSLWKNLIWLSCLIPAFNTDLNPIINDHIREKQNSRKGRLRHGSYWSTFRTLKSFEAHVLFAIYYSALKQNKAKHMIIWNGLKFRQRVAISAAKAQDINCLYMENGLLPGMTTLDSQGINFQNSVPRSEVFFDQLNSQSFQPVLIEKLSKPLTDQFTDKPPSLPEHYIFVPFQVNTDSQIILFSPWIKDMIDLVKQLDLASQQLGQNMPDIIFKPHPACDQKYDALIEQYKHHDKLHFNTQTPTPVLIQHAKAVATINSTVGIESLLLNKKLITLGHAFYQLPRLCLSAIDLSSLTECLKQVDSWEVDQGLRTAFFNYLAADYQVPGRWQEASDHHLKACAMQLASLIEETESYKVMN